MILVELVLLLEFIFSGGCLQDQGLGVLEGGETCSEQIIPILTACVKATKDQKFKLI